MQTEDHSSQAIAFSLLNNCSAEGPALTTRHPGLILRYRGVLLGLSPLSLKDPTAQCLHTTLSAHQLHSTSAPAALTWPNFTTCKTGLVIGYCSST